MTWNDISTAGPTARWDFAYAAYNSGDQVYVHGGQRQGGYLGDLWRLDLSTFGTATWQLAAPYLHTPVERRGHAASINAAGRLVIGMGNFSKVLTSDLWEFDTQAASPAYQQIALPDAPQNLGYSQAALDPDPLTRRLIVFSGEVEGAPSSGLWQLDFTQATPAWSRIVTTGPAPSPRVGATLTYDGSTSPPRMLLYGGRLHRHSLASVADLWALELWPAGPQWVQLTQTGSAGDRKGHGAVMDGAGGMLVFGGTNQSTVMRLDVASLTWSTLTTTGSAPPWRSGASLIYDNQGGRNRLLVFGGVGTVYYSDVWQLDFLQATPTWSMLSPAGAGPGAVAVHSSVHDVSGGRVLTFGGYDPMSKDGFFSFDLATDTWTPITGSGYTPQARWAAVAVWDDFRSRMVLVGGFTGYTDHEYPLSQERGRVADTWYWGD
jgi:hypothetical protein